MNWKQKSVKRFQQGSDFFEGVKRVFPCLLLSVFLLSFFSCRNSAERDAAYSGDTSAAGKAIAELTQKIKEDSSDAELFFQRSRLFFAKRDMQNAFTDASAAVMIDSTKPEYFLALADYSFAVNKTYNSKIALEKCLTLQPDHKEANMKLAELYFFVKEYGKSVYYLNEVLKKEITNPKAYFMKGMNYKEMGDTAKAISGFQTATEQNPEYYDAFMQLGILTEKQGNALAAGYYSTAIKLNPSSEEALYGRGLYYQNHNEVDKAINDYTSILQLNPQNSLAHYNIGYINMVMLNKPGEAAEHFTHAIESDSAYVNAWYNRGIAYEMLGRKTDAILDFRRAMELQPTFEKAQQALDRLQ